jgi:myo-inositol-1(or 4)-monophosphatase
LTGDELLDLFVAAAGAVREALEPLRGESRRDRTDRPGQYALDLVADAAALEVLAKAPVAVVSEESGVGGKPGSSITVVLDPVDGSTNASRGIPYWSTSLCAVDGDGPLAALVVNQATGATTTAVRGGGAWRDGARLAASPVERVQDALVHLSGRPARFLPWKQFRSLGSAALALCDLAAGTLDGFVDGASAHAPWDYLGGLLACSEAGAVVVDTRGRPLIDLDPATRRQLVGAANAVLLEGLMEAVAE